jgi:predicted metal-binding membrane protein
LNSPQLQSALATLERAIRSERAILAIAIAVITLLAWGYLLGGAGTGMSAQAMTTWRFPPSAETLFGPADWKPRYALMMTVMWFVMMIAMMLPSAAPMMMIYARVYAQGQRQGQISSGGVPIAIFAAGYLLCWLAFAIAATALQFTFERAGVVDGMWMWSISRYLTAGLLIAAGLYQFSGLKRACLNHCRSPASFLSQNWRPGRSGAFRLGLVHGAYCLGCCWVLMLLLFAGGVMNLIWIAGLSILVLIEKLGPFGARLTKPIGVLLIGAGIAVAAA